MVSGGAGDALRTMRLLWEGSTPRTGRGPKATLTLDEIVVTAITIADQQGSAEISMRSIGDRLGRTPMALYTYVGGRAELMDLMYDRVHAEFPKIAPGSQWRQDIADWAQELLTLYIRHPWVNQVSYSRPVLGPHEQQVLESLLALLPIELKKAVATAIISTIFALARSAAKGIAESRAVSSQDAQWWQERMAALTEVVPDFASRFPHFLRYSKSEDTVPEGADREGAAKEDAAKEDAAKEDAAKEAFSMERSYRDSYTDSIRLLLAGAEPG